MLVRWGCRVKDARLIRALNRLEDIGLQPFSHSIINMELKGCTFDEHIEWILTADAQEIRSYWEWIWYR
jgi:hypothetical protein